MESVGPREVTCAVKSHTPPHLGIPLGPKDLQYRAIVGTFLQKRQMGAIAPFVEIF